MQFTVEFFEDERGRAPVRRFLDALERDDPRIFVALLRGLARLKDGSQHRLPLCRALGDGLFELRHLGSLNTRVLWFFFAGRRIILVHGIRHKAQAIRPQDLRLADERRRNWMKRQA